MCPLVFATCLTLDRNCDELSPLTNIKTLLENNSFKHAPLLDPTAFILTTVDTIDQNISCVWAAFSTILTENCNQVRRIEEIIPL